MALIAVGAVDGSGCSTSNLGDAAMMAEMISRAERTAILADSTKLDRRLFAQIVPLEGADYLVTDRAPSSGLAAALDAAGVLVHGDARARALAPPSVRTSEATDEDWATEYHGLEVAIGVVDSVEEALEHIRRWSSQHTEAVVTRDLRVADAFVAGTDSAAVMVNASTRFTDGGEFGLGAEVGISTQKLHARGPMGLAELTTTRWVVHGQGQVRG